MKFGIPESLRLEHEELHEQLAEATQVGGKIGEAAEIVAELFHAHADKEEEYALPPLGLLTPLAEGKVKPGMSSVLDMTDKLKSELKTMLQEHKAIVAALSKLADAAKKEKKLEIIHFTEKLTLHARTEEEVTYPTAILIGEYVRLELKK